MKRKAYHFVISGSSYPRIDATQDLILEVKQVDVDGATRNNPNTCVISNAARRSFGDAFIQRTEAIIIRAIRGKVTAVRYALSAAAQRNVKQFDSTGAFPVGEYRLLAIPPSHTAKAKAIAAKKRTFIPTGKLVSKHMKHSMLRTNTVAEFA